MCGLWQVLKALIKEGQEQKRRREAGEEEMEVGEGKHGAEEDGEGGAAMEVDDPEGEGESADTTADPVESEEEEEEEEEDQEEEEEEVASGKGRKKGKATKGKKPPAKGKGKGKKAGKKAGKKGVKGPVSAGGGKAQAAAAPSAPRSLHITVLAMLEHMCSEAPDRADVRTRLADSVLSLLEGLQSVAPELGPRFIVFLSKLLRSVKVSLVQADPFLTVGRLGGLT